jgi:hypothetical protein
VTLAECVLILIRARPPGKSSGRPESYEVPTEPLS